jgi:hypothetical protein
MPESATVIPIKPRRQRSRKPFKFPKHVGELLYDYQNRVYEALAVAKLLAAHNLDHPGEDESHLVFEHRTVQIRATDAVVRLLEPVRELDSEASLLIEIDKRDHQCVSGAETA